MAPENNDIDVPATATADAATAATCEAATATADAATVAPGMPKIDDPRQWALIAARAADERKATDIMVLQVGELIDVTEYFVIATARNTPQVQAILENIEDRLRIDAGIKPSLREETRDHSWEILDYGSIVVDVFQPEAREYYRLETLWGDAPVVDLAEAGIDHPEFSERIAQLVDKCRKAEGQSAGE